MKSTQVFWLTGLSQPRLPVINDSGSMRLCLRLQRRDRSRFSRDSLNCRFNAQIYYSLLLQEKYAACKPGVAGSVF